MEVIIYLPKPSETISLKIVVTQELLNAFSHTFPVLWEFRKKSLGLLVNTYLTNI